MAVGLNSGASLLVYQDFQALSSVVMGESKWPVVAETDLALCMCKGACPGTVSLQSVERQRCVCSGLPWRLT